MSNSAYVLYLQALAAKNADAVTENGIAAQSSLAAIPVLEERVAAMQGKIAELRARVATLSGESGQLEANNILIAGLIQLLQNMGK